MCVVLGDIKICQNLFHNTNTCVCVCACACGCMHVCSLCCVCMAINNYSHEMKI